jgi:hypothetical protein
MIPLAVLAAVIVLVVAGAGLFAWMTTDHAHSMPQALVWRGTDNYLEGEYAGPLMTEGCHTVAQIDARGLGPVRRIGVVGRPDQMPVDAYVAWQGAMPIVAHGPGHLVLGAFPPRFVGPDNAPNRVFVERSPECLIEYPPPGG